MAAAVLTAKQHAHQFAAAAAVFACRTTVQLLSRGAGGRATATCRRMLGCSVKQQQSATFSASKPGSAQHHADAAQWQAVQVLWVNYTPKPRPMKLIGTQTPMWLLLFRVD